MGIPDEPFWAPDDLVPRTAPTPPTRRGGARRLDRAPSSITLAPSGRPPGPAPASTAGTPTCPSYEQGESLATRKAIQKALDATYDNLPGLLVGFGRPDRQQRHRARSATSPSTDDPGGRYLHFGIREHAMGSAMVGMSQHGGILPIGGTFFVFSDYMRPPIRLAALTGTKVCFVFTHDSVGVGEDGPTHQPVEQLASLRAMPGLHVMRPADGNETIHAWADVVRHDGPSALILSRQNIRVTTDGSAVERGAGIVTDRRRARRSCSSAPAAKSRCASTPPTARRPTATPPES